MFNKNEKEIRYRTFIDSVYFVMKVKHCVTDDDLKLIEWFMRKTKIQQPVYIQQQQQPQQPKTSIIKRLTKQDKVTGDFDDII